MTRKAALAAIKREVYEDGKIGRQSMRARIEGHLSAISWNLAIREGLAWRRREGKPVEDEPSGFWCKQTTEEK